ncbi:hypothetical protein [Mesobacillus sp. S13]|uniref:hypothetical protein n=1 Tax=Mesobacillus sp. S13 TaxID=2880221 RepID=UPI001CF1FDC0|nr:hypothetical protein [Mesobacillus sp. S13]
MALAPDKAKSRLDELKKRAAKRKKPQGSKPSKRYLEELSENANLLYADQISTME